VTSPVPCSVRIIVVNYDGGALTLDCLRRLLTTDWPAEQLDIVLVDNASRDGVADRVERELAGVRVIRSTENRGFAGGCNLGMRELGGVDAVALVNNDVLVESGWLRPLVEELTAEPRRGAACPKIRLLGPYRFVDLETTTNRRGWGDRRRLGVHVSGIRVDGDDRWSRTRGVVGCFEPERGEDGEVGRWTEARARLAVPAGSCDGAVELRVAADSPRTMTLRSGDRRCEHPVERSPTWCAIPLGAPVIELLHNTGSVLTPDDYGADRGYLEIDDGRFDRADDVFAWCGGAVLLRREYLDDVGVFDEDLFLYYEDLELAWRGGERGWSYRYVPRSRVDHVHGATSGDGSSIHRYYNERNRLLVLSRHAPWRRVVRAIVRYLGVTGSYGLRDVVSPLLRGEHARTTIVNDRIRALCGYVLRVPRALALRRRARRRP
jgi:GT2 family glycosyltransferase